MAKLLDLLQKMFVLFLLRRFQTSFIIEVKESFFQSQLQQEPLDDFLKTFTHATITK